MNVRRLVPAALLTAALVLASAGPALADDTVPTGSADPTPTESADPTPTSSPDPTATVSPDPTTTSSPDPTPTVSAEPTLTSSADPTTTSSPTPTTTAPRPVHYRDCGEVHRAGHALLLWWQDGYRDGLDRDNDGVACESGEHARTDHRHVDWSKADGHQVCPDSSPSDNDDRTVVVKVKSHDDSDSSDSDSVDVATVVDAPNPVYTQWSAVPSGAIDTGSTA